MVTGVSFILILRSYSGLEISFAQILCTLGFTFLTSLTLGSVPGMGSLVAISLLCSIFGKGIQEGYLILKPVAPLLISAGVILDVVTSAFVAFLISRHEGVRKEIEVVDYL
jgi:Na+/H+-dicarboxylate symporter